MITYEFMINLVTLQENLENLSQNFSEQSFVFDLLSVYELPKSTISLLSKNPQKLSGEEGQIILKNKLLFQITEDEKKRLQKLIFYKKTRIHISSILDLSLSLIL